MKNNNWWVYCIKNIKSWKKYIWSTSDFRGRKDTHFSLLKSNKHYNKEMQKSFNKYWLENFDFIILKEFKYRNDAFDYEEQLLSKTDNTYNSEDKKYIRVWGASVEKEKEKISLAEKILRENRWLISDIARTEKIAKKTVKKVIEWDKLVYFNSKFKVYTYFLDKNLISREINLPDLFQKIEIWKPEK